MDYSKIYRDFIASRVSRPVPEGYTERHHILPKSLGGDDSKENIVRLTARDHFFAHMLLAKIHGGPMNIALWRMSQPKSQGRKERGVITSRQFSTIRNNFAKEISGRLKGKKRPDYIGEKISKKLKGRIFTEEWKRNMSRARIGKKMPEFTEEWRRNMALAKIGEKNPMFGKPTSAAQKKASREASLGKKSHRYNHTIFDFIHDDGARMSCTQYELREKFGLNHGNLSLMCSGKRKSCGGWRLFSESRN